MGKRQERISLDVGGGLVESGRYSSVGRQPLSIASTLKFTPISLVWRNLSYYVTVPKGSTGAAALNVMPEDAGQDIAGKKRLLNNVTGTCSLVCIDVVHGTAHIFLWAANRDDA
jgi:hypothetical protein